MSSSREPVALEIVDCRVKLRDSCEQRAHELEAREDTLAVFRRACQEPLP